MFFLTFQPSVKISHILASDVMRLCESKSGVQPEKTGYENGPFTKDPKIKYCNAIFHIHSAANEFTRKLLKNFAK